MPKHQGKYLYVYIGRNGFIISLDFDFKGKAYDIEFSFFWCRFNLEGDTLKIKGKEAPYCQNCAKKILRPQENQEEQCINSLTVFRTSKNKCENLGKS